MRKLIILSIFCLIFFTCPIYGQMTEIAKGQAIRITFNYVFQDTSGNPLSQSDIIFDFAVKQAMDDALVDSVSGQNYVVVGDTIRIDNFSLKLPEGEYYLAGYARRLDNGISSKPGISNEFAILDLNPPDAIFYIMIERVPIK